MRVVLDTNTLASGLLGHSGSPASRLIDAWRDAAFTLVVSADILAELAGVLAKPYFATRLDPNDVIAFLDLLATTSSVVVVKGSVVGVAGHPEDDRILECALVGQAVYLVTGDKELQALRAFQGVEIVTPRRFVEVLEAAPRKP